jgi:RNA polymerase sigma factor (sigma-70 family)
MEPPCVLPVTDSNLELTATLRRETAKLAAFIRKRVGDVAEAEDLLQDVFVDFVRAYRLPEPIEQVSNWLFRVARNRIVDRYRKQKSQALAVPVADEADDRDLERLDPTLPALDAGPDALLSRSMLLDALQRALDELPAFQRDIFIAHEIEGLSFKEIAQRTGVPLNTLLGRKRAAVLHLRSRLQPLYDELNS